MKAGLWIGFNAGCALIAWFHGDSSAPWFTAAVVFALLAVFAGKMAERA